MPNNIVDLDAQQRERPAPPVTDFWFAQLDQRLQRIEQMVDRLEWQFWIMACGAFGVLILEILQALSRV